MTDILVGLFQTVNLIFIRITLIRERKRSLSAYPANWCRRHSAPSKPTQIHKDSRLYRTFF